jgi:hypothetical protein
MIITRSWVYLEFVFSASTGGNSRGGGDGKTENNVVVVEEATAATIGNTKTAQRLLTTTFLAHAYTCKLLMHHQPLYSHINPSPKSRTSLSLCLCFFLCLFFVCVYV